MSAALEAMRVGADLAACAIYPVALAVHRVSGESLAEALKGLGLDTGVDVAALWEASEIVDQHIGDEPVTPLAPRVAVRAAEYRLPAGLVAGIDASLRAQAAGDRLDEVLEELSRIRGEVGSPPLAAPIGQILGSQALIHVLSAQRYLTVVDELRELVSGAYGTPPGDVDPGVRRALELVVGDDVAPDEPGHARGRARADARPRLQRGRAAPRRALRRRRRGAAAGDSRRAPAATTPPPAGSTGHARNGSARSSASSRSPASAR